MISRGQRERGDFDPVIADLFQEPAHPAEFHVFKELVADTDFEHDLDMPQLEPAATAIRAACKVFLSSMAMVIGPTPPGTGVMCEATRETLSK